MFCLVASKAYSVLNFGDIHRLMACFKDKRAAKILKLVAILTLKCDQAKNTWFHHKINGYEGQEAVRQSISYKEEPSSSEDVRCPLAVHPKRKILPHKLLVKDHWAAAGHRGGLL